MRLRNVIWLETGQIYEKKILRNLKVFIVLCHGYISKMQWIIFASMFQKAFGVTDLLIEEWYAFPKL
jgi:hypothetical protein